MPENCRRCIFSVFLLTLLCHSDVGDDSGVGKGRVISGDQASVGQFPWSVLIACNNFYHRSMCSGSLLSDSFVLTAAHCLVDMVDCTVVVGDVVNVLRDTSKTIASSSDIRFRTNIYVHPCYTEDLDHLRYDVGLLELQESIKLTAERKTIRLPEDDRNETEDEGEAISVGWGNRKPGVHSEVLRYTKTKMLEAGACAEIFSTFQDPYLMCARSVDDEQMVCHGDSGGPVVKGDGDDALQIGVNLFILGENGCKTPGLPQGFLRVAFHVTWIRKVMKTRTNPDPDDRCPLYSESGNETVASDGDVVWRRPVAVPSVCFSFLLYFVTSVYGQ